MTLQERLQQACEDYFDVSFRNNYSGRGMFGRRCVGITGSHSDCMKIIGAVIKDVASDVDGTDSDELYTAVDTLLNFEQDSMGFDVIIYWRCLEPILENEEESSEET